MNTDIKNFLINVISGLFTAIVFLYLERNGFTTLGYIVFGLYVLLIVLAGYKIITAKKPIKSQPTEESDKGKKINTEINLKQELSHKPLDDIAVNILLRLWKFPEGLTDQMISKMLEVDIQTIKYHLEKLEPQKMVHGTLGGGLPRRWRLIQGGREYLIENKLIS